MSDVERDRLWAAFASTWIRIDTPHGVAEIRPVRGAGSGEEGAAVADTVGDARGRWPWLRGPVVVITAWNPYGERDDQAANAWRQRRLINDLDRARRQWWPAVGISDDGRWSEESVAVPGLGRPEARRIGARWRQEAIFEWDPGTGELAIVACTSDRVVVAPATVILGSAASAPGRPASVPGAMPSTVTWPDASVRAGLAAVGAATPLVHCLTNIVVAGFTANVLLAVGASPAMVENAEESATFAAMAGAVLVNLGTLSAERDRAMVAAAAAAHGAGRPWVLDPVAVGALAHRRALAATLMTSSPTIVRGNASEIMSLAGVAGSAGRGVDSGAGSDDALDAAGALARDHGTVVAVSGEVDYITDGSDIVEVPGGHRLMTKVTGVGCALGGLMAAFAAVVDPMAAAVGASAVAAAAGGMAAAADGAGVEPGPGTFAVRLIDELWALAGRAAAP